MDSGLDPYSLREPGPNSLECIGQAVEELRAVGMVLHGEPRRRITVEKHQPRSHKRPYGLSSASGAIFDARRKYLSMSFGFAVKLLGAEIMVGLRKVNLPGVDFVRAKELLKVSLEAIHAGQLGYAVVTALRPN